MHRIIASIVVGMAALALAGCSSTDATKGGAASNDGEYKVAIAQYASFPPLDEAVAGFKAALSEAGLDVTYDASNAQGDQTNVNSIASKYAAGLLSPPPWLSPLPKTWSIPRYCSRR